MYEFKGTKGTWGIDRISGNNDILYIGVMKHDDWSIEKIVTKIELSEHYKPDVNKEHEANAYLISASPKLLEACIDVLYFLENMDNPRQESINERVDTLQDAINKALNFNQ